MADPIVTIGGLTMDGTADANGVWWRIPGDQITGWWSSPAPVLPTAQRPRGHGAWVGESWLPARTITVNGYVGSGSPRRTEDAINRLIGIVGLNQTYIQVETTLGATSCYVHRSGEILVNWVNDTAAKWSLQLIAPDPRRLGAELDAITHLPSTSGGITIPLTVPFTITSSVVSGQMSLTNPGNIAGPVLLVVGGPVVGPIVTHVNSGKQLVFASSLSLGSGEFVTVDMDRREVLAQGQASRNGWVISRGWSGFDPGVNTWAFTSAGAYDPGATLVVGANPAWM